MARLPSRFDLSQPTSLRSGRAIASVDTSGLARGLQSLGNSVADIGADIQRDRATVDVARAEAYKTKGLIDVTNDFSQDGDYTTFDKRAPGKTADVVKNAASLIRDPRLREKWQISANTDAVRTNDAIGDRARTLGKQAETVAFDDALEVNRRIYVDPDTTDEQKAKAKQDIEGAISVAEGNGLLTPDAASSRRDKFVRDADVSRVALLSDRDPEKVLDWIGRNNSSPDVRQARMFLKGRTDKDATHIDGLTGNFAVKVAKMMASAPPEIAKELRINSGARSVERQEELWQEALKKYGSPEAARKWVAPPGNSQHNHGNAADLGYGSDAARKWVHDNAEQFGLKFPLSNENWHIEDSSTRGGVATDAPAFVASLSPEQRQAVYNRAETRSRQISAEQRGAIENVVQNAPSAIQNTGDYSGTLPTRQDFTNAYGFDDGVERFQKFNAAVEVSQQAYDFRTMSSDEIQQAVKEAIPTSSGDDAALETTKYETLSKAAASTLAARKSDPATYTMQAFPNVDAAWQEAQTTRNFQPAMSAMAAAQRDLGIKNPQLLPKAVSEQSVTNFKDANLTGQDRLNAVAGLVFSTSDPAQRNQVFNQLVEAGLPPSMEGVFEALARGDQGAANRLMEAVTVDPAKLPSDKAMTPAQITDGIYSNVWAPGEVGYTSYGLAYGDASSLDRAQRGTELMNKAVRLRMARGEDIQTAIDGAKKDLFGNTVVFDGTGDVNADLAIPADTDQQTLNRGLEVSKSVFRRALDEQRNRVINGAGAPSDAGQKAILETATENRVNDIMTNGVFVSTGNGVGLRDPYTGQFVTGSDGQPLTLTYDQVQSAAPQWDQNQLDKQPDINSLGGWAGRHRRNKEAK